VEVSEIVESVDILEYIQQFCELEEKSDGEYWGLSPLQEEKTPSFSVNTDKQRFYDFSSGQGGNVLDFIKAYYDCNFQRSLQILKQYAGINEDDGASQQSAKLLATTIAKKFRCKKRAERESKSTILPPDYMDRYESADEKLAIWENEGIKREMMEKYQVKYDRFSDRLVYPIRDINGNIINVGGRTLDEDYKEKGLRKYTYFKPLGKLDTIYGLSENHDAIMEAGEIILFEGAKSVMKADGWGFHNVGAVLTSHLNPYQFKILIQLGVHLSFALDAEVDIRKDANIMRLLPYADVYWIRNLNGLLDDKDAPVDKGYEVFQTLYNERRKIK